MDFNGTTLEHLSREECLLLVGQVPVGRIVYTRQALPAVELVNFAVDDGDIIIRTDSGGKLAAATRGAVVAFEADSVDGAAHAGWSVTVVGYSRAVTDEEEIRRLEQVGLVPWAPGKRDHFIRISPTLVNGRRLAAGLLAGSPGTGAGDRAARPAGSLYLLGRGAALLCRRLRDRGGGAVACLDDPGRDSPLQPGPRPRSIGFGLTQP